MSGEWLKARTAGGGEVSVTERGWRLQLSATSAASYQLAQIDDYWGRTRRELGWKPPVSLCVRARVSSAELNGTWGFGLWNDPFGLGIGPTHQGIRLPALPQAAWFFHAGGRSYLSFRDDKPATGFLAQTFRSTRAGVWLGRVALAYLASPRRARGILRQCVHDDAVLITTDPTEWHRYEIRWDLASTTFAVDQRRILQTDVAPTPPLGLVVWIDNQYAAFKPNGDLSWGIEANSGEEWLEIEALECVAGPGS